MSAEIIHERGRTQNHGGATWVFGDNGKFWITQEGRTGCAVDDDPQFQDALRPRYPTEAELVRSLIGDPR